MQVKVENVLGHLEQLEKIAHLEKNKGSRAIYLGYNDSVDYVIAQLQENTNYVVSQQFFEASIPEYQTGPFLEVVRRRTASVPLTFPFRQSRTVSASGKTPTTLATTAVARVIS